ncbi:MFS transporter [Sulfuriferula thiophila]|uniref:MFS transporter n=1 Tax=Sulfuriferula thiophila TaxID=1781211 RepID=UPI000F6071AF|nr:MFS transporter [Sulfuriferula thiophila]
MSEPVKKRFGVHPDVLKLGFVSFLTDLSSEMIFSVFAIFFTTIAGASSALLGLVEGLADFSASSLNYMAGWLSDRSGKRKVFALAGYGFSTLAKVILLFANSIIGLGLFRVIERLGKGFRGPPRDAWLSAIADKGIRGYSFGVHKALDKAGAVFGPLVAYALLSWYGESAATFKLLFWVALVPAVLSIILLGLIKEQPGVKHQRENMYEAWQTLSAGFKRYLIAAGIFSLAYFSFGFLLLRAYSVGFSMKDVVLLYALFNVAFVIAAPMIGKLGDVIGRTRIIVLGYLVYLVMNLGFVFATTKWEIIALFVIYGIFFSIDEAQSKAFITDIEPERRATAIGVYNFVTGMIYLPASLIAGALWLLHPTVVFMVAACLSLAAIAAFLYLRPARQIMQ